MQKQISITHPLWFQRTKKYQLWVQEQPTKIRLHFKGRFKNKIIITEIQFQTYEHCIFHYLAMRSTSSHWNDLIRTLPLKVLPLLCHLTKRKLNPRFISQNQAVSSTRNSEPLPRFIPAPEKILLIRSKVILSNYFLCIIHYRKQHTGYY